MNKRNEQVFCYQNNSCWRFFWTPLLSPNKEISTCTSHSFASVDGITKTTIHLEQNKSKVTMEVKEIASLFTFFLGPRVEYFYNLRCHCITRISTFVRQSQYKRAVKCFLAHANA